jgi:hypothetical protein
MTRLRSCGIKSRVPALILPLLLLLLPYRTEAQNIYDQAHSREFAQYLMQSRQYQLAAAEWERVLFFSPADSIARLNLVRSFRLSDKPAEGLSKINQWHPEGPFPRQLSMEAAQMTLMAGNYDAFTPVLERSPGLTPDEKSDLLLGAWLMEGDWINRSAKSRTPGFPVITSDARLLELYTRTLAIHRKSPGVAVFYSTFVPGLGKIYSGDWKDGLISLLFVATNVWQSYRGFSKNGIGSVTGWVFGGLAAGFYTANLFGSWKSATDYNYAQTDRIRHEAEGIIFTR